MSKKIAILGAILVLALVLIIGFLFIQKKTNVLSNPIKAIPTDASLVIQINNFNSFNKNLFEKNRVISSLGAIPVFGNMHKQLSTLDSLARHHSNFGSILFESQFLISGHFIGGRKTEYLFIAQQNEGRNLRYLTDVVGSLAKIDIQKTERKYEGQSIYVIPIVQNKEKTAYYFTEIEGNILFSKSIILIENALRQFSMSRSLLNESGFKEIIATAGKSKDANLYIDFSKFPAMLSVMCHSDFGQQLKKYSHFGGWAELDLNATESQIMLNGFLSTQNSTSTFESVFRDNTPVNFTAENILPAFISTFITVGAEDMHKLHEGLSSYLGATGTRESRNNQLQAFATKYGYRLDDLFLSIADNELTIAWGSPKGTMGESSAFVLIKCKSATQADKKLKELTKKVAYKQGRNMNRLIHNYSVDNDTKYQITELPLKDPTGLVFGSLFSIDSKSYYTVLGNYIVISNSKEDLGQFLYNNVLSKTLNTNEAYKNFSSSLAQKSYMLFYNNLSKSSEVFSKYLHQTINKEWEKNFVLFHKVQPVGLQLTEVSGMNYINILAQYIELKQGKPKTIWESLLDSSFTMKPQLVENHYTKQNEIFFQDQGNTIYLINKAGRILWKQKIIEAINSQVYQIDYYKNGKLQYLFSTSNYLHLIDRNGNYTERYPVRLRASASAGMALFDYEKNRNYRIFIPCEDNKVYAYTKDGKIISGWQFPGSEYPVNCTPEHFLIEGKDFIVFADKVNTYILDRRGNTRVQTDQLIYKSKNNTFYLDNNKTLDKSRIVTTDTTGAIVSISFTGKTAYTRLGIYGSNHYFDFNDVNADGINDYIILDENRLEVFEQNKTEFFNFSIPNTINQPTIYFNFSYNDRKIGFVDTHDEKIYLLNSDGKLYKGFPLTGKTLFSIGYLENSDGNFNLIVGGSNNFLYNYSVH